jgi:hypothetical protein
MWHHINGGTKFDASDGPHAGVYGRMEVLEQLWLSENITGV